MGNVIKKVSHHPQKSLLWFHIFLPADMAIFTLNNSSAIETILFLSFRAMGHVKISLKISTKQQVQACFSLLYISSTFEHNQYHYRMKNILFIFTLLFPATIFSQYYYNDILDARTIGERMKNYVSQKVKTITATGYDSRGAKTTYFNEWQEINAVKKTLKITTRNGQQVNRQYFSFDNQYRLLSITDSSGDINSITTYTYDNNGNIISIKTSTKDSLQDFSEIAEHQYNYSTTGKPEKLRRIINGTDSSEYRFTLEENKNVADEQLYRRGVGSDPVYYYYDDKNRLTDIVRYNKKAKKLLPTQMFEYDESDRVIQKMTVLSSNNPDYLLWRYLYNDKGLKTKEALFNKQKELTGRIEYAYTFE
jgi:YD repeat-containing protein